MKESLPANSAQDHNLRRQRTHFQAFVALRSWSKQKVKPEPFSHSVVFQLLLLKQSFNQQSALLKFYIETKSGFVKKENYFVYLIFETRSHKKSILCLRLALRVLITGLSHHA